MSEPHIHKSPHSFYFDFRDMPKTASDIIERINKKKYDNLDTFLKNIEWELVGDDMIEPINVRHFTKCISDEEVRLDVLKFLKKYARQYFRKAAEDLEYNEHVRVSSSVAIVRENVKTADENFELFENELGFLIDQLEEGSKYTGDRFKKQEKRIEDLEKEVAQLKGEKLQLEKQIASLNKEIDRLAHPERQHQISNELQCEEFYYIITYLQKKGIVTPKQAVDSYYRTPICYHWNTSKALFGYFICKVCYLLELRTKNDHLIWKPFKLAFDNFEHLQKQARDIASKNKNWEDSSSTKPDDAYIVDEALQYCAAQMELSKKRKG